MFINDFDLKRGGHDDVEHGFAIFYQDTKPDINIAELQKKVDEVIAQDLPITYVDESHIRIGDSLQECDGPRVHVTRTGQIQNFRLMNHFLYDRFKRRYMLIGCVGENSEELLEKLDIARQRPYADGE